jgi:DNA primase
VAGYALVTEGYMDVVALAQLGFANAVATLGTACTPDHVQKLFRFTDAVVFSFDGDGAGRRAARKALDAALPLATDTRSVKFLFLPAEHDPDSFIRANGSEAFAQAVKTAVPLSRFLIDAAGADCDLGSAEGRARMASQARPLWSALPDGALKRQLIGELAEACGLGSQDLLQLWQHAAGAAPRSRRAALAEAPTETAPPGYEGHRSAGPASYANDDAYAQTVATSSHGAAASSAAKPPRKWQKDWRKGPPPPRMLGQRLTGGSRADRAVGLLLANAQAWDQLSADDHAMLAHLPEPHGAVFAWLESQLHEHGPQPWAALREALRGSEYEAFVCAQVEQATAGADPTLELAELNDVMDRLRGDALEALAGLLAARVQGGDASAYEEFKQVNERIKALKSAQSV